MYIESKRDKILNFKFKRMASLNNDKNVRRSYIQKEKKRNINDKTNNNNIDNILQSDCSDIKGRKDFLEQRKQNLESLLREKYWILQQIQKKETQVLNEEYKYINLNDIFVGLEHQYKQEMKGLCTSIGGETTSILRRKSFFSNHDQQINNNINSYNSNRSSEYDNYPRNAPIEIQVAYEHHSNDTNELAIKTAINKRSVPITTTIMNLNYLHMQQTRQQHCMQIEQAFIQHQHDDKQKLPQHHMQQKQLNLLQQQVQNKQLQHLQQKPHDESNFLPLLKPHKHTHNCQSDGISLISFNSGNNASLRQKNILTHPQPMIMQCDKYYLSPTHQSYNEGNFIKCSQNIKKYVSPANSPTSSISPYVQNKYEFHNLHQSLPLQQAQSQVPHTKKQYNQGPLDIISIDPSYTDTIQNYRWRSQTSLPLNVSSMPKQDIKSNSSEMLSQTDMSPSNPFFSHSNNNKKPYDEISISSLNNEMQKKTKPKKWTESSLDGPIIRLQMNCSEKSPHTGNQQLHKEMLIESTNALLSQTIRDRNKLSSQSMSSASYYSKPIHNDHHTLKFCQDDDGRYAKLSQSTSFLNLAEQYPAYQIDATQIRSVNHKNLYIPETNDPERPPSNASLLNSNSPEKPSNIAIHLPLNPSITASNSLSTEICIESPQNMTVVQQATFQPYKEITKPFEMSDFYKYSTKFRQNKSTGGTEINY